MRKGNKVLFTNDLGRTIVGFLMERNEVVAEAEADTELNPTDFKDVSYFTWDIKGTDGKMYVAKEDDIHVIQPN